MRLLALFSLVLTWPVLPARAEDPAQTPQAAAPADAQAPAPATESINPQPSRPRGKYKSEKEAEGTKAPDRFQADTVIKSQYRLNGQQLEVDPD